VDSIPAGEGASLSALGLLFLILILLSFPSARQGEQD
jgi:hypothetical protein